MEFLLTDRYVHVEGTWYAPTKWLESKRSVVCVELINTTSSAGDWGGFFVQKRGKAYKAILFWQSNSYPGSGFDLTTDDIVLAEGPDLEELKQLVRKIWS